MISAIMIIPTVKIASAMPNKCGISLNSLLFSGTYFLLGQIQIGVSHTCTWQIYMQMLLNMMIYRHISCSDTLNVHLWVLDISFVLVWEESYCLFTLCVLVKLMLGLILLGLDTILFHLAWGLE